MILLTKLNKKQFYLNCEMIECIESKPDTLITLRNGKLWIVEETPEKVVELTIAYKKEMFKGLISPINYVPAHTEGDVEE